MKTRIKNLTNVSDIWDNPRNETDIFDYINDLGIINDIINFSSIKQN